MTIEEKVFLEKVAFAAGFGDWLCKTARSVGDGNWVYLDDSSEEPHGIFKLVDYYVKNVEGLNKNLEG